MTDACGLSPAQRAATEGVLAEESARRSHLVVSISGAHAYGFPSTDSDVDVKCVHVEPTRMLVGLRERAPAASRMADVGGIEIDYTSNEIAQVLRGALKGDGNFLERVLGSMTFEADPAHGELRGLLSAGLSRRVRAHYAGFSEMQLRKAQVPRPAVKSLLYVLRTALTGAHALLHAEIVTDVARLFPEHGFEDAAELVERKRMGERALLEEGEAARWIARAEAARELLARAGETSRLPQEAPAEAVAGVEGWLQELRRARW